MTGTKSTGGVNVLMTRNKREPNAPALPPEALLASLTGQNRQNGLVGALRTEPEEVKPIGQREIQEAADILTRYKQGKANLESRIVEDELWWEGRHWEAVRGKDQAGEDRAEPTSAWLFNCIMNKHADAMDNYPEPIVLPRERSDEETAKVLSSVLPVLMEYNDFEQVYSDNWWEKLKHGTAAYGIFWNPQKENGLGDVDIHGIDLLKLFWEPGITDIQKSRNLFIVDLVDEDLLDQMYPEHKGKMGGGTISVKEYLYSDQVDNSKKSVVVDWYYKKTTPAGKTVVHYAQFVGDVLLYASENDEAYRESGWYDNGLYPVVLDVLFPEKGTPVGFGYVAICKDPQLYIDKLMGNILDYANEGANPRFFISESTAVNEDEFLDKSKKLIHVAGELDDRRIKQLELAPLSSIYVEIANLKIDEMKETAANRDVNSGATGGSVTAAAAIAALQEAGNKASRDMIGASYRADTAISGQSIDRMRQFYDEERIFRITGENGDYRFVAMSNAGLKDQVTGTDSQGFPMYRRPIFDLKIKAQKKNPFSRMEQNEQAKELYKLGFFNPERAQEALPCLEMMEFEGIEKVREQVRQGQTLLNMVQQLNQRLDQMALIIQQVTGQNMGIGQQMGQATGQGKAGTQKAQTSQNSATTMEGAAKNAAKANMTSYGQKLASRVRAGTAPGRGQ